MICPKACAVVIRVLIVDIFTFSLCPRRYFCGYSQAGHGTKVWSGHEHQNLAISSQAHEALSWTLFRLLLTFFGQLNDGGHRSGDLVEVEPISGAQYLINFDQLYINPGHEARLCKYLIHR